MNRFRAEIRKIWTIRSTYILTFFMLALGVGVFAFFAIGFKNVENAERSAVALQSAIRQPLMLASLLLAIVAIISVGHEYRYNTILYSLTSARQRMTVLVSKLTALLVSALFISIILAALSAAAFYVGQSVAGINTVPQAMPGFDFIWRMVVQVLVYVLIGFGLAVILRSLIAAIAIVLIVPSTVESLLYLLLKENTKYLPFTAVSNIADTTSRVPLGLSAVVVMGYVGVLLVVAAVLFQKRDAN